jgi:hypothetical protein
MGRVPTLFLVVVEYGFCWGFCRFGCAERGFLRGKRGEVVVNCVAGSDRKKLTEIGTAFLHISEFIFARVIRDLSPAKV